jgi:ElaB/YqjD/DUF883 family membrane-anchored ribosome-binding protein
MSVSSLTQETKNNAPNLIAGEASAAEEAKGNFQEMASAQALQDVAADVSQKAQDWAANVANKAQETASAAVDKTDDNIAAVGHRMNAFADTVRETAPKDGVVGSAATTMADNLQAGGRYLEGHGLQDMGKDLTAVVRHYPIQSVLIGFGLGCLLGMTIRRR